MEMYFIQREPQSSLGVKNPSEKKRPSLWILSHPEISLKSDEIQIDWHKLTSNKSYGEISLGKVVRGE